jgi:hypothetical protein
LNIVYTYSPLWLLLIFLIAGLIAYWLYRGDKVLREVKPWLPLVLAIFRFISLSLIAFFLLEPLIKSEERDIQRPIVAIAVDNSESIQNGSDSTYYKNELANELEQLANDLASSYEVELFSFDENVSPASSFDFNGKITNLSKLMNEFETRYYNRNLGAIILASDGNYNQGINPVYHPVALDAPLYAVLLGDTGKIIDAAIEEVISNSLSFLGDDFPVEINVDAEGMDGQRYQLEIYHAGKKLAERSGTIKGDNWAESLRFSLSADKVGVQAYSVILKVDEEEQVTLNNRSTFYIRILDERLKIAIISSTPHPDVATWSNALSKNKNYEVDVFEVDKFSENISNYSLFILYQLPSKINHTALIDQIIAAKIPFIVQVGLNSNVNLLNQVLAGKYSIVSESNVDENFKAKINRDFSLFSVDKQIVDEERNFPPLAAPLISVSTDQLYQKLMTKQIGQLDTDLPIWILSESTSTKNGIIIGEGIWRWSINSYLEYENHDVFDDFLQQSVKYLIRKGDNKRFVIDLNDEFYEDARIKINAKLLDPSMEFAHDGDISFTLKNEKDENFEYSFVESTNNYMLDLGVLAPGDYSYQAKAKLADEVFTENGKFTIMKRMLEQKDMRANAALMYQWADKTGGALYYPEQIEELKDQILQMNLPSISYQTEHFQDMIRMSCLLFVIALFLSVEWFLRRYFGSY